MSRFRGVPIRPGGVAVNRAIMPPASDDTVGETPFPTERTERRIGCTQTCALCSGNRPPVLLSGGEISCPVPATLFKEFPCPAHLRRGIFFSGLPRLNFPLPHTMRPLKNDRFWAKSSRRSRTMSLSCPVWMTDRPRIEAGVERVQKVVAFQRF